MGKRITAFLLACLCLAFCCFPAAAANQVSEMEIEVVLRSDGSAAITQVWTASTDEGTEFYLACRDSGYLRVTDFSVSDEAGPYTLLNEWDVDASFEEKARKCGIVETGEGVELCWGISEYGSHSYTLSYVLHDLVGAYSDADGFNHRFVDDMSTFPTNVAMVIRMEDGTPLTEDVCGIWAFGYDGQVRFEDGMIYAWSQSALESGEHMTVMVSLEKGLLSPLRASDESFEDVKKRAFEGSDYEKVTFGDFMLGVGAIALVGVLIGVGAFIASAVRKAKLRRRMEQADYFREAPNNGNLNVTYRLGAACELCKEDALMGAYLLRLISDGALDPMEADGKGEQVDLRLNRPPRTGNAYDDAFYTILEAAVGEDGILQAHELEQFCERNGKPLAAFAESCRQDADGTLIRSGCYKGAVCNGVKSLTEAGMNQLDEILGLKRFLLDFSLVQERTVQETVLWQDYLIYAHLLGIADQVAPQIRKLYPDALPQVEQFERYIGCAGYYSGYMYNAYAREQQRQEESRRAGSGGSASSGGGGGFSGGGGGGTR